MIFTAQRRVCCLRFQPSQDDDPAGTRGGGAPLWLWAFLDGSLMSEAINTLVDGFPLCQRVYSVMERASSLGRDVKTIGR